MMLNLINILYWIFAWKASCESPKLILMNKMNNALIVRNTESR